ncbi:cytochrome P450 4C1-like isoform X2 [Temnothorax americanus]|uniref:cytochrome P450 4C1-like isoform X2 n=1 Tax=Temnothorax americanus TaxID=1964332 RepID=UPI004069679B
MIITIFLLLILILLMYNYYLHHGRNGRLINLIPGPPRSLFVGNLFDFLGSREKLWEQLVTLANQYYPILKFWEFILPVVSIRHPDDLETILSSTKHIQKSFLYDSLLPWLGTGLLTSGETAMGTSLRDLGASQQRYREAVHQMGEHFIYRLMRPWLHVNWIFWLTPTGREQRKILKILHGFTEQIIAERKLYHNRTNNQYLKSFGNETSAERDDAEPIGIRKKRLAMLDLLIAASREGLMTDLDVREEIDTFMFEGHDTTAMGLCFIFALLAEHKDIQDRVRNEIDTALQENDERYTMKLLQDLPYLDRCIKEALRLYPSVFLISRYSAEDVKLQSYLVPAGTLVSLNIYAVHRDPNFWPNPDIFDPDRFLPEKIRNRHPYSYLPFSAGPRNCIGQRFAMLELKAMIAPLVHNFYLEPIDYLKNLRMQVDLVLRPAHPLRVKFIPVCKGNSSL